MHMIYVLVSFESVVFSGAKYAPCDMNCKTITYI